MSLDSWIKFISYVDRTSFGKKHRNRPLEGAGNTRVYTANNNTARIKLHDTYIMEFHPDGSITLNSGGWRTVTTKERINRYLPSAWSVYAVKGTWFVDYHVNQDDVRKVFGFADGMRLYPNGTVVGHIDIDLQAMNKLATRISRFARAYATEFIKGKIEKPGAGDCLMCSVLVSDSKKFIMEKKGDEYVSRQGVLPDHLIAHMDEKYYVPSLLARAMKGSHALLSPISYSYIADKWRDGVSITDTPNHYDSIVRDQISKTIRRYMRQEFDLSP